MALDRDVMLRVGKLCTARFRPGFYAYAGSALGPGGVAARVGRHARPNGVRHWHVDHLRRVARVREAWFAVGRTRREHTWARALAGLPGAATISGFGASDCRCPSHLVYFAVRPAIAAFRRAARENIRSRRSAVRRSSPIERIIFA